MKMMDRFRANKLVRKYGRMPKVQQTKKLLEQCCNGCKRKFMDLLQAHSKGEKGEVTMSFCDKCAPFIQSAWNLNTKGGNKDV